jgi:hypothetical protein
VRNHSATAFRITPSGTLTMLHSFTSIRDGSNPIAGLVEGTDGNFYGTTFSGGGCSAGAVFKM